MNTLKLASLVGLPNIARAVDIIQFREQILPTGTPLIDGAGDGKTTVWGYAGNCYNAVTGTSVRSQ